MHDHDMDAEISAIRVRSVNQVEKAAKQLFQVVKDHNNPTIQEMLDISNVYCYRHAEDSSDEDSDDEINPSRLPIVPSILVVVNEREFSAILERACNKLRSDGLVLVMDASRDQSSAAAAETTSNEVAVLIRKIAKAMELCSHAIYRSQVYARPDGATFTYVRMMDVTSYLHKLLANDCLRDGVIKHFQLLHKFLGHPACEIIEQLTFNNDLIEVSNGFCFSVIQRRFIPCPLVPSMRGKISPRAFVPYDCSTPPEPGHFRYAIVNSFEDPVTRVNFLNKFYQCLLASRMPHKVRKLVVVGPRDSGKTSWANVFHRVVPSEFIASITNERQFSAAMIKDDTQLVIVDEWSSQMMTSHLAKTILQGGWIVTAVKHGEPRQVLNNSPYYITSNNVPDFGDEHDNVGRRIQIFRTKSLPSTTTGMDKWVYDNAMHCIAWIADELAQNHQHIASEELWYEQSDPQDLTVSGNQGMSLFRVDHLRRIGLADLRNDEDTDNDSDILRTIHDRFAQERRAQRFRRRRQRRRRTSPASTDDDEDSQIVSDSVVRRSANCSPSMSDESQDDVAATGARQPNTSPPSGQPGSPAFSSGSDSAPSATRPATPPAHSSGTRAEIQSAHTPTSRQSQTKTLAISSQPSTSFAHAEESASSSSDATPSFVDAREDAVVVSATTVRKVQQHEIPDYPIETPQRGWAINTERYHKKVAQLVKHSFYKELSKAQVYSYQERLRKARLRRTLSETKFWQDADPEIDAFLLMLGQSRDVFNMVEFAHSYPQCSAHLDALRRKANVRVMSDRCPFAKAVAAFEQKAGEVQQPVEEEEELDRDGDPARPPLSSQSYWTKIKKWRPW